MYVTVLVPIPATDGVNALPDTPVPVKVPPAGVALSVMLGELTQTLEGVIVKAITVVGVETTVVTVFTALQPF